MKLSSFQTWSRTSVVLIWFRSIPCVFGKDNWSWGTLTTNIWLFGCFIFCSYSYVSDVSIWIIITVITVIIRGIMLIWSSSKCAALNGWNIPHPQSKHKCLTFSKVPLNKDGLQDRQWISAHCETAQQRHVILSERTGGFVSQQDRDWDMDWSWGLTDLRLH